MKKHNQTKKKLKIAGGIFVACGAVLAIIGFVDFFSSMNGFGAPRKFWCLFIGIPLVGVGLMLLALGFRGEMMRYVEKESAPVINEAAEDLTPAVKTVVAAVKEGEREVRMCSCGAKNDADSKFCKTCGKPLVKKCESCGADNDADSVFCDQCGKRMY